MPLRDDLLTPIPGANPAGENLRYAPVYDKIREARREDDDAAQGDWKRDRKVADWAQVVKLASDSIATKSKDLQLAAWLTEAIIRREGFSGLRQGLTLCQGIMDKFWDGCYPLIEDGDVEERAAPLEWIATRLEVVLKTAPLTKAGHGFFKFKESKTIPTEDEASQDDAKAEKRRIAIEEKKLTQEEFESAFRATPKAQYESWVGDLDGSLEAIENLAPFCDEKFGEFTPSWGKMREMLEEIRFTANSLLQRKVDAERPAETVAAPAPEPEPVYAESGGSAAAAAPAKAKRKVAGLEPVDVDDAAERLAAVARFLRQTDAANPSSYLLLRGFRWGELRAQGESPDPALLVPPPTDIRQQLKRLSLDGNTAELIETAETAMAQPCGRAWLDLQRYVVKACDDSGYYAAANAIRSAIKALVTDLPKLAEWTMMDDTATANGETQAWLKEFAYAAPPAPPEPEYIPQRLERQSAESEGSEPPPPDAYDMAMQAARRGQAPEAIEILMQDAAHQGSGRGRFQRRVQLAQVCMGAGYDALAQPILEQLVTEMDRLKLEDWESADLLAHPLVLLYRCLKKSGADAADKQKVYARICRLDPVQALSCMK